MSEIIMWSLLAFFGAFGLVEFIRFVYTDWNSEYGDYHVVISTRNKEENIESVIRNTVLATDCSSIIVISDEPTDKTLEILERLQTRYPYIRVITMEEYLDFLNSEEC